MVFVTNKIKIFLYENYLPKIGDLFTYFYKEWGIFYETKTIFSCFFWIIFLHKTL